MGKWHLTTLSLGTIFPESMTRFLATGLSFLSCSALLFAGGDVKVEGYAEWRKGSFVIVDGQRVQAPPSVKFKGDGAAKNFATIPLGYEIKLKGVRFPDGSVMAREIEAKPNGEAMFEGEVRGMTDEMEKQWLKAGRIGEEFGGGDDGDQGKLYDSGPQVMRVRRIVERLVPPYRQPADFRVYVAQSKDWNAFACANGMIVVYSQMLLDMSDDELGIVLGHEIAHATHEHTRRQFKKAMWIQLVAIGVIAGTEATVDKDKKKTKAIIDLAAVFGLMAWKNGYGRDNEDQADRVGLRYAFEGGFDVRKGPGLWKRFAQKYGDQNRAVNFFFGDHSQSTARAANLDREIAMNYAR